MSDEFAFLVGETVSQIWVWGPIRLVLELGRRPEPGVYVDLICGSLTGPAGEQIDLDPSRPADAGPVLGLLHQRVVAATETDGILTLRFDGGHVLRAVPDDAYESWTVVGNGGRVYQCLPGGDIGYWGGPPSA